MKSGLETGFSSNPVALHRALTGRGVRRGRAGLRRLSWVLGLPLLLGFGSAQAAGQPRPTSGTQAAKRAQSAKQTQRAKRAQTVKRAKATKRAKARAAQRGSKRPHARKADWALRPAPPNTPAAHYAELGASDCKAELTQRGIAYRDEIAPGVEIPVRLLGPVGGVLYRTDASEPERRHSPWEVFDCRLVLSLADLGPILARHEVVEARIFSAWRPLPHGQDRGPNRRHPAALAVDVRALRKANGEELVVLTDFEGRIGARLCPSSRPPAGAAAAELLDILCAAADAHCFNSILTPNYDALHKNHFHLELTPGVGWFMLR